jgi:hypothetical protein
MYILADGEKIAMKIQSFMFIMVRNVFLKIEKNERG